VNSLAEWTFLKSADDAMALEGLRSPTTAYGKWLYDKGHLFPSHKKPGVEYVNIYGNQDRVKEDNPIALVVYEPTPAEHHYEDLGDALHGLRRITPEDWQIIDLLSGDVLAEPKGWRKGRKI
jgi:hypothetical protein